MMHLGKGDNRVFSYYGEISSDELISRLPPEFGELILASFTVT
jgi:hypothetical protein